MKLLLLLLVLTSTANAQGVSYIGLCNETFDCNAVKATWYGRSTIITGWLEQTFGLRCKCADELLKSRKNKIIRVHLANSPCLRNNRCGRKEVFYGETIRSASRKIEKGSKRFLRKFDVVAARFKKRLEAAKGIVQCYISPCLECDLSIRARQLLLDRVSVLLPMCLPVDNPLRGQCIKGFTCERHGKNPKLSEPCIADLDGVDGKLVDLNKFRANTKDCDIRFYWEPFMNCNIEMHGKFIDPEKRLCRANRSMTKQARRKSCRLYSHPSSDIC